MDKNFTSAKIFFASSNYFFQLYETYFAHSTQCLKNKNNFKQVFLDKNWTLFSWNNYFLKLWDEHIENDMPKKNNEHFYKTTFINKNEGSFEITPGFKWLIRPTQISSDPYQTIIMLRVTYKQVASRSKIRYANKTCKILGQQSGCDFWVWL